MGLNNFTTINSIFYEKKYWIQKHFKMHNATQLKLHLSTTLKNPQLEQVVSRHWFTVVHTMQKMCKRAGFKHYERWIHKISFTSSLTPRNGSAEKTFKSSDEFTLHKDVTFTMKIKRKKNEGTCHEIMMWMWSWSCTLMPVLSLHNSAGVDGPLDAFYYRSNA